MVAASSGLHQQSSDSDHGVIACVPSDDSHYPKGPGSVVSSDEHSSVTKSGPSAESVLVSMFPSHHKKFGHRGAKLFPFKVHKHKEVKPEEDNSGSTLAVEMDEMEASREHEEYKTFMQELHDTITRQTIRINNLEGMIADHERRAQNQCIDMHYKAAKVHWRRAQSWKTRLSKQRTVYSELANFHLKLENDQDAFSALARRHFLEKILATVYETSPRSSQAESNHKDDGDDLSPEDDEAMLDEIRKSIADN